LRPKTRNRRTARRIALALIACALWPAAMARATPPSVTSVAVGYDIKVEWALPEGMKAYSIEVATSPETYAEGDSEGGFLGENWAHSAILLRIPEATSWSGRMVPSGTYYVHVAAIDGTTCTSPLALGCPKEWSEPVAFSVPIRPFGISVSLTDAGRVPYMSWGSYCCPSPFDVQLLEIATDPDTYDSGPFAGLFLEENLVMSAPGPFGSYGSGFSYNSHRALAGGTFYLNAVAVDRTYCPTYEPRALCGEEVSKPIKFTVPATPPVLTAVRHQAGVLDLEWDLPWDVNSDFVEVATSPDVYGGGPLRGAFREENTVLFDDYLGPDDLSYTAAQALPPGTYYVHVAAYVPGSCATAFPPGCFDDFSQTARITIAAPPAPAPTPTAASADRTTAFSLLRVRSVQSVRRLAVRAVIDEDAVVRVSGYVSIPGVARALKVRAVKRDVAAGEQVTLRLKLSKRALAAARRALARHRRVAARLTVTARDRAGNETTQRRTVRLRR
jgi:hypothetical protein